MWGGVHMGLSAAAVITMTDWGTTVPWSLIGEGPLRTLSVSRSTVLPAWVRLPALMYCPLTSALTALQCRAFFFFNKQKRGVAPLWGSRFLCLSLWHWLHAHICVSMNQFSPTADAMLRKCYFHFRVNYSFTKDFPGVNISPGVFNRGSVVVLQGVWQ